MQEMLTFQQKKEHSTYGNFHGEEEEAGTNHREPEVKCYSNLSTPTVYSQGEDSPHITSDERPDDKGHDDEQAELLATSANAGEGENQLHS